MRTVLLTLIIVSCMAVAKPGVVVDANSIITSPTDPTCFEVTVTLTITKEHGKAIQKSGLSLEDVFKRSNLMRVLDRLVADVKQRIADRLTISQLEKKETE